jgi:hypothetical protein
MEFSRTGDEAQRSAARATRLARSTRIRVCSQQWRAIRSARIPAIDFPLQAVDAIYFSEKQDEARIGMRTKSIRLTDDEAADLKRFVAATGEVEATVLKRAALRGLEQLRLEQGILAFVGGAGSAEAAEIAGLPRAIFLQTLIDKGITILQGPSTLAAELESLGADLGNEKLQRVARKLAGSEE